MQNETSEKVSNGIMFKKTKKKRKIELFAFIIVPNPPLVNNLYEINLGVFSDPKIGRF